MATSIRVSAVIFDLDGVLVDSRAAVDEAWLEWCLRHGVDPDVVRRSISGMRTRDAVARFAPESDIEAEAAALVAREESLIARCTPVPGARELLESLPVGRWGIATSGTDAIARARLAWTGLPIPGAFVTAEMVARGKPDPEVYERTAAALGVASAACAVFEDAPSGIAAANAAGALVIGVLTWAQRGQLASRHAVADLRSVRSESAGPSLKLIFDEVLG